MAKSAIAKGAVISYVAIFLNLIISFAYTPWMIHKIGISDYGLYTLTSSFIGYFILDFGMASSIARFIAKYRVEGREDKVANMLGITTRIYLFIDIAIFIALFVLYFFVTDIFKGLTPSELIIFKRLYVIAGSFSIMSFVFKPMNGAMMAYEYFVENKLLDMVTRVGTVIFVVIALLLGGNVYFLVLLHGIVGLSVAVTKYLVWRRKSGVRINWRFYEKAELLLLFSFSAWIFLGGLAQRFRFTLVQSILGIFSNSTQISVFSVGMMIEGTVYVISSALSGLFLPKVTRMSHNGDKRAVMDLMVYVGRLQLYVVSIIFFGFLVFGDVFVDLWVGTKLHNVYYVTLFLIATNLVTLPQSIANDYVMAENRVKTTSIYIFVSSAIGILIGILLASNYGAIGCAFGTFFALALNLVMVNVFYHKKLGLNMFEFFRKCHLKVLPLILLLSVAFFLAKPYILSTSWLSLILWAIIFFLLYIALLWMCIMNKNEKNLVLSFIK